jgi:DNA-directed RNA polymerase subunit RPC12/RpoP
MGSSTCIKPSLKKANVAGEVNDDMEKITVVCTKCGNKFETNSPFPKTTCPVCHYKTDVKPAIQA